MKVSAVVLTFLFCCWCGVFSEEVKDECGFSDNESVFAIQMAKNKIAPLFGHSYISSVTLPETTYVFTVGICKHPDEPKLPRAAVVQQEMENGQPKGDPRMIGSLDSVHVMSGSDWAVIEYHGGENYSHSCGKESKRTVIMLQCDATVDDDNAEMIFMSEEKNRVKDCYYLFELKHKALCPEASSSSSLSVGSILVIVFFSLVAVYLLVGFLYSRFVLGAKGREQIPNYEFWQDFGNLQADGCDFVCRTKERVRSGGFRGIGDEQLETSEELIRDDNLLPM